MIMKRIALLLVILTIGCAKNRDIKSISDHDTKVSLADQLGGYWLSDSYLVDIENSHSIFESSDYKAKYWGFKIEKENLLSGAATINTFDPHEGGYGGSLKFDSIKNEFSFPEEPIGLKLIDSIHLQLDFGDKKDLYRKVLDEQTELRKLLFEGKFKNIIQDNQIIEFTKEGQITGLNKNKYFELVYDFGEGINYDVSIFYPNQDSSGIWSRGNLFHFKIKSDTIKLYKITPDWNEMNHKIGDLEYVLVRS
jgi:hypothetical protein